MLSMSKSVEFLGQPSPFSLVLGIMLGLLCSGCLFPKSCRHTYAFEFPISVTAQDTFAVGDTIWLESNISNQLLNHQTGEYIDLTHFDLYFSFFIEQADSTIPITGQGCLELFEVINQVGQLEPFVNRVSDHNIKMASTAEKRFRVGLIASEPSTYVIGLGLSSYYYALEESPEGRLGIADDQCFEKITSDSKVMVNNGKINFYLIKDICRYNAQGWRSCYDQGNPEDSIYGGYAFHVKAR